MVVVGSQRLNNPGPVPIAFSVPLNADLFDPAATAQLWAIVVDGNDAWVTPEGVAVATNGAPSDGIVVRLTFRPDALEGQVTGFTVGAGSDLSAEAVSMTWVLNATTLVIVGFDSRLVAGADPIPFAVPFSVTNLDAGAAYVAEIVRLRRRGDVDDGRRHARDHAGQPDQRRHGDRVGDHTVP